VLKHHPRYLPERLVVFAVNRLAEPTKAGADERRAAGDDAKAESDKLRHDTIVMSRVNGAVAGTPFFVALLPAYLSFLWAQARMVMRIAALHGRDPTAPGMAAEILVLRGIYPDTESAQHVLDHLDEKPSKAERRRDRLAAWVFLVRRILILAAFTSASNPDDEKRSRLRQGLLLVGAGVIWIITCLLPLTFMILMSWSCETSSRQIGKLATGYYGEPPEEPSGTRLQRIKAGLKPDPGRGARRWVRWTLLAVSIGVPLAFVALGVSKRFQGVTWVHMVGALAGLALVIAMIAAMRRR
jgi:hypothetical protein